MKQLVEKDFKFEDLKVGMEVYNSITEKWFEVLRINEDETNVYPISTIHRSFTKDGKEHVQSCVKLTKMRYEEEVKAKKAVEIPFNFRECKVGREVYNDKINDWQEVIEIDANDNVYPIKTKSRSYSKDGQEFLNEGIILARIRYEEEIDLNDMYIKNEDAIVVDTDVNGSHYAVGEIETIDVLKQQMTEEQFEGFLLGNILKYGLRCNHKSSKEQDLKKVLNYAHKLVEGKWFY